MDVNRTRAGLLVIFLVGALPCLPAVAGAREKPPNTVEFWGGLAGWSGDDAHDFDTGPATGATFLFHVGIPVEVGLDVAFARMDSYELGVEVDEFSASAAARYRFTFLPVFRPFVGLKGGYTRLSADYADLRFEQNGGLAGGNAGLEIPMGSRVMLVATGEAMYYSYGDTTVFLEDIALPSTGGHAWRYVGRMGFSFRWRH